ncbi:ABC transporter permease [Mycobacterium fragae]|uniref:ABC transporter permease n=2 Tax=Mycobacterium fragae TaxID=1260918 RepID=A0A1X1UJI6_9MYCO|nr:ABC transporter permease [Mycobacterium fragae]ORV56868.1 ABC transporter permease [Mycobacterium fragae]
MVSVRNQPGRPAAWSKPAIAAGDFVVLAGETLAAMFRRPFAWRELLDQIWFVARVSIVPTLVLSIPYTVLIVFTLNIVLIEVGAGDLSGAGAALASVTQVGPVVTAIVVSGAAATAMCADLGARTIREEIDAMKVIGVNPIHALVVPRVIAATFVALMLYSVVAVVGLFGSYFFVVFVQHVTPGAFVAGMTLLTGLPQVVVSLVKAALFGLSAGLIACYKGLSVGGGPTAVGEAVNETVVFAFMALFLINILATAFGVKVAP